MRLRILSAYPRYDIHLALGITPEQLSIDYSFIRETVTESFAGEGEDQPIKTELVSETTEQQTAVLTLKDLQARRDWKSGSVYSVIFDSMNCGFVGLVNDTAESYSSRRGGVTPVRMMPPGFIAPVRLALPFENADFSSIGIQVIQGESTRFSSNEKFDQISTDDPDVRRQYIREYFPVLELQGPDEVPSGELAMFTVTAAKNGNPVYPLHIYFQVSGGYMPKERVELAGPTGTFRFRAMDLAPGDEVEIKAGFRYLTSRVRKTVRIV